MAVGFVGIVLRAVADRKHIRGLQEEVTRSFVNMEVESEVERLGFRGATAVIERRGEVGGLRGIFESRADMAVAIYARNEDGERFLFKWHSKSKMRPYIQHLGVNA